MYVGSESSPGSLTPPSSPTCPATEGSRHPEQTVRIATRSRVHSPCAPDFLDGLVRLRRSSPCRAWKAAPMGDEGWHWFCQILSVTVSPTGAGDCEASPRLPRPRSILRARVRHPLSCSGWPGLPGCFARACWRRLRCPGKRPRLAGPSALPPPSPGGGNLGEGGGDAMCMHAQWQMDR